MVADLREMQENQGLSEIRIDKLEFIEVSLQFLYLANSPMIQQSCRPQP